MRRSGGRCGRTWRSLEALFSRFGLRAAGGCPFDALLREKFLVREAVADGDLGDWRPDKTSDGRTSIEEFTEMMEDLVAGAKIQRS
uniref:Uncharacterized protein n=1 Tax=Oryza meridionalis TaxID=40149 RepID=A0A0E0DMG8_9ORYZ